LKTETKTTEGEGLSADDRYQKMLAQEGEVHPKYGKRKKNHLIDLQKNKNKDLEDYKN
jgi:hypothetical protein